MNVSEVATSLGYPDIYTFSQAFKKEIGVSPKKYAERISQSASIPNILRSQWESRKARYR